MTYANSPHITPDVHIDKQDRQYGRLAGLFFSSSITIITCVRKCSSFDLITGSLKNCKATIFDSFPRKVDEGKKTHYGGWKTVVAYFCHHMSYNYVDLSDLYIDLSVIYVDLSDHYADLTEKYHHN